MINYYTISSENIKKYYNLEKPNGYYDFSEIKSEALEKNRNNRNFEVIKENVNVFDEVIKKRREREKMLKQKLNKHGIQFIPHGYLTRRYIMHNYRSLNSTIKELYKMHILFTKCDIKEKWDQYKSEKGENFYSMQEKDKFYKDIYNNYIKSNPNFSFRS